MKQCLKLLRCLNLTSVKLIDLNSEPLLVRNLYNRRFFVISKILNFNIKLCRSNNPALLPIFLTVFKSMMLNTRETVVLRARIDFLMLAIF